MMTNSADPDQMQHSAVSDLGLQCLLRPVCPNAKDEYGIDNFLFSTQTYYWYLLELPEAILVGTNNMFVWRTRKDLSFH